MLRMMKTTAAIFFLLLAVFTVSHTQTKKAQKKEVPKPQFVILCLSAHPDDEDGATLAYYGKIENMKAYSVFFTRGEGGQNETGSELYDELGSIRTRETMNAAKILGTEIYFLGFPDFGFSKTAKESFSKWGGNDYVLSKLVYVIRTVKPDVIITNHDTVTTKPRRQHGNHQVVGITAYEAFAKAADPTYHPEQLKHGVTPWQVKKLFFRAWGVADSVKDSVTTINTKQEFSTGVTVEDIALSALQQHRSQGMARLTLDSLSTQFRRHKYRLMRSDRQYEYDDDDLFMGLTASARTSALPKESSTEKDFQFSVYVSPNYTSTVFHSNSGERTPIKRPVTLTLANPTGSPLNIEVLAHAGSVRMFQKSFSMQDSAHDHLSDTVLLHLEDVAPKQKTIDFVASPKGSGIHPLKLLPSKAEITLVPPPGTVSANAVIGLIRTYDNTLEQTMHAFDIPYQLIDSSMLASGALEKYSVILLDLRSYLYRPDAAQYSSKLLDFARNGGNLVVFYHKTGDWNGKQFAPFPLTVTAERVTEEDAPVTILLPHHSLFNIPNHIGQDDWSGWVQERSIYLPSDDTTRTSSQYQRLLAMSDEGEHQPSTSLLWAQTGKGTYTYVSLALYRQLRILQGGAVKLFFNLVSQPRQ